MIWSKEPQSIFSGRCDPPECPTILSNELLACLASSSGKLEVSPFPTWFFGDNRVDHCQGLVTVVKHLPKRGHFPHYRFPRSCVPKCFFYFSTPGSILSIH